MSIDCHSNNKLKYEFFYPNAKAKLESSFFSRKTRIGGDDKYYWYYLNNLMFDEEVMQLIRDSYDAKISYLK